jgi:hypothetical protein
MNMTHKTALRVRSRVTPSVPPSISGLIARREADVRAGRLAEIMAKAPEVHFALMAALWAQQIGLPAGNYWEFGLVRHMLQEYRQSGDVADVVAATALRLGLDLEAK